MEETKIYKALLGVRGRRAVDLEALDRLLVRFSTLVVDQRWIKEIDINPLVASARGIIALDARVVLYDADTTEDELPKLAIRPYPMRYIAPFTTQSNVDVRIRPIRPEDEPMMAAFNRTLSPESVYLRYFHPVSPAQLISHEQLASLTFIDYDREISLVAEHTDEKGRKEIIGMGQLTKLQGTNDAEFSVLISDNHQRTGLGTELLRRLLLIARDEGIERVVAEILHENEGMRRICAKLGFKQVLIPESRSIFASVEVDEANIDSPLSEDDEGDIEEPSLATDTTQPA
jgi:acetyltransferase